MAQPVSLIANEADATLRLHAEIRVIGSISDFTYKWCINNDLNEDDTIRLALAVDELVTDIVRFAYPMKETPGEFEIHFMRHVKYVEIKVHEWGEPFDPDLHTYDHERALKEARFEGAGLRLINLMTDEFSFVNHGRDGKSFRMVKYYETDAAMEESPQSLEDPESAVKNLGEITFNIDPITVDDAEEVAKLIYRCYGNSYPKEEMYHPKRIEQAVVRQKKIGVIAHTSDRQPAGYFAVINAADSNIGEVGEAVVAPPYRRRGLFKKMMEALIQNARKNNLLAIYGHAIAIHEISQRVNFEYGFHSTAILLADFPPVHLHGIAEGYSQPVWEVVDFLSLVELGKVQAGLPDCYKSILTESYEALGANLVPMNFEIEQTAPETVLDTEVDFQEKSATVIIRHVGSDYKNKISKKIEQLQQHKLNVIYLDVPLNRGKIDPIVDFLHQKGFIFSGLHPLFHHEEDYLRMQLLFCDIDLSKVVTYTEKAKKIKAIIARELL